MNAQNPTSAPVHSELGRASRPACGSEDCMTCPQVPAYVISGGVSVAEALANAGASITSGQISIGGLTAKTVIDGNCIKAGTITADKLAPAPLTVKQAAKAYRKAVRAAKQADVDAETARAASKAAYDARDKAYDAVRVAREALEKAAEQ